MLIHASRSCLSLFLIKYNTENTSLINTYHIFSFCVCVCVHYIKNNSETKCAFVTMQKTKQTFIIFLMQM